MVNFTYFVCVDIFVSIEWVVCQMAAVLIRVSWYIVSILWVDLYTEVSLCF